MAEETTPEVTPGPKTEPEQKPTEDQQVPYERFQQVNDKAKQATEKASGLEKQLEELRAKMEEREQANLPELERERQKAERLADKLKEAEQRAEETAKSASRMQAQQWVERAAARANFHDPDDAVRNVDLDDVSDSQDAERQVKQLAKLKGHLVKQEEPKLPGRVLQDGRQPNGKQDQQPSRTSPDSDAEVVGNALRDFLKNRSGGYPGE